jgi:hypothetical protein
MGGSPPLVDTPPAALEEPQRDPVRVLVAPYMLTAVKLPGSETALSLTGGGSHPAVLGSGAAYAGWQIAPRP